MKLLEILARAAAGTGFTFLMTTLGAAAVFFFRGSAAERGKKPMLGFAAGVMTAATVWSLLLPAIEQTASDGLFPPWLPAAAGILLGVTFLAGLDSALPRLRCLGTDSARRQDLLLITAITLHNIPEGMAVGLAFALAADGDGVAAASALALGIGIQNFPEGTAVSLPLLQEGKSRGSAFLIGMCSGAVEPLAGVAAALAAAWTRTMMPWLLCFAAGAMLYVTVEELIPQAHSRGGTCGFVAGFLLMMVLDVALG